MSNKSSYMDRALKSRDPRYARILTKLGYATRHMQAEPTALVEDALPTVEPVEAEPATAVDELAELRAQYQSLVGKRPYHGWDADELRKRIDEAQAS